MKEELYVILSGNKRRKLDLNTPSGITMKWVSNLFSDLSKLTCSYSYTFKLPITRNNREIMDMAEDIRHTGSFAKKRMDALFLLNGVEICKNANLYLSEVGNTSYSCVMTWGVLTAFQKLKDSGAKLEDLTAMDFLIKWEDDSVDNVVYGKPDANLTNKEKVVYPDYDAGYPHFSGTPPKPCVPIFALIELIKDQYGVKFDIGKEAMQSFGMMPMSQYNVPRNGARVYDDFITFGVVPLVGTSLDSESAGLRNLRQSWNFSMFLVDYSQEFTYDNFDVTNNKTTLCRFYNMPAFRWNGATGEGAKTAVIRPLYAGTIYHEFYGSIAPPAEDTGQPGYEDPEGTTKPPKPSGPTLPPPPPPPDVVPYFMVPVASFYNEDDKDYNTRGVVGFKLAYESEIIGTFKVKVKREAVTMSRVLLHDHWWVSVNKVKGNPKYECKYDSYSEENELELKDEIDWEHVSSKDPNQWTGLQSLSGATYDASEDVYVYEFDMGKQYIQRRLTLEANDEDDFGYFFLPYLEEDVRPHPGEEYIDRFTIKEGDVVITDLVIDSITPSVSFSALPATMHVGPNLPNMSCFDFMKAIIYMNGAVPYVKTDGETIAALYYNEMRDKVWDGVAVDWSKKIFGDYDEQPSSIKMSSNSFGQKNYFEMAYSTREKKGEDLKDDFDVFEDGCATLTIEDFTLAEEKSIYKSPFYPGYKQDIRYPLVVAGSTTKIWDTDKKLTEDAKPIYGIVSLRGIDTSFESPSTFRHIQQANGADYQHVRLTTFSVVDKFQELFGYLQTVLNNYTLIKEKFKLDEFDLSNLDVSMPIYLDKYNSYFALSTLQRDSKGVCTAELIRLPVVEPPSDEQTS